MPLSRFRVIAIEHTILFGFWPQLSRVLGSSGADLEPFHRLLRTLLGWYGPQGTMNPAAASTPRNPFPGPDKVIVKRSAPTDDLDEEAANDPSVAGSSKTLENIGLQDEFEVRWIPETYYIIVEIENAGHWWITTQNQRLEFFFLSCLYIETCQSGGLAFVPTDSEEKDENRTEFPADSRVLVQQRWVQEFYSEVVGTSRGSGGEELLWEVVDWREQGPESCC